MLKILLALLIPLLAACASSPPRPPGAGIAFGLMGDTPYSQFEALRLDGLINRLNEEDLAFIVHIGDITSGQGPCTDEWFLERKKQFERIRHPFVLIPGDNDWTDCHRSGMDPMERLAHFRALFEAGDQSLGQRKIRIERQSDAAGDGRFAEYREHMRWTAGNVLFVTLNVQGSNDNLGRTAEMDAEHRRRAAAVAAWLAEAEQIVTQRQLAGLVIAMQANPDFEEREVKPGARDGHAHVRDALRALSQRLGKPVVLVHGDTHSYRQDQPLKDAGGGIIRNFTRVEVDGSPWVGWLRGTLFPSGPVPIHIAPGD